MWKTRFKKIFKIGCFGLIILIVSLYALKKYSTHLRGIECKQGMQFDEPFQFSTLKVEELKGAKVYIIEKGTNKVLESTTIVLREYNGSSIKYDPPYMYQFLKPLPTSANWEIKLAGTGKTVIVSDIETIFEEYNNSIGGSIHRCEVFKWKIDGKPYTTQEYHYFLN